MDTDADKLSFWEHLDVLRAALVRVAVVTVVFGCAAFCFKDALFAVVLAPKDSGFVTYRLFSAVGRLFGQPVGDFSVQLINTGLAGQFVLHMKTAAYAALMCASPYIIYELFRFVSPALYSAERRCAVRAVGFGYALSVVGVLLSYFLIFPFTFRFLGTYQVSPEVGNMITLDSYISTLITLSLAMGMVFEIPVVAWLLARMGLLSDGILRRYRKHAVVVVLVVAAVITPTSDVFTLLLVALPMWMLYEASVLVVARTSKGGVQDTKGRRT